MEAVLETIGSVLSALTVATLAHLGVHTPPHPAQHREPEKVVARSVPARPAADPRSAVGCPQVQAPRRDLA